MNGIKHLLTIPARVYISLNHTYIYYISLYTVSGCDEMKSQPRRACFDLVFRVVHIFSGVIRNFMKSFKMWVACEQISQCAKR